MHAINLTSAVRPQDCRLLREAVDGYAVTLASTSPRRREILKVCGVRFKLMKPDIDEPFPRSRDHRAWVRRWAMRKAADVALLSLGRETEHIGTHLFLAADTIVVCDGRGLGKPKGADEATDMLRRLSGCTHNVISGVAAVAIREGQLGGWAAGSEESRVKFRRLSRREIEAYVATGEPFDKAGGYAIQGQADRFVEAVDGPIDNVVGLPVGRLGRVVRRALSRL